MVEDDVQIGIGVSRKVSTIEKGFSIVIGCILNQIALITTFLNGLWIWGSVWAFWWPEVAELNVL